MHRVRFERWYTDQNHFDMSPGSPLEEIEYIWDAAGQLTEISDASAEYDYLYDDLGRATTIAADLAGLADDVTLAQEFDPGSLRTQLAATIGTTDDFVNDYAYDQLGRMIRVEQHGTGGGNSVAEKRVDFAYNRANQFETIERYADLAGTEFVAESAFEYDGRGRLTEIAHEGE